MTEPLFKTKTTIQWPKLQRTRKLSGNPLFEGAMIAAIVANAVLLGAETYVDGYDSLFVTGNTLFLLLYVVELGIRLRDAGSLRKWAQSRWNLFDAAVIVLALIPAAREAAMLIRLVRVVKVVRYLPELRIALSAVARSLPGVASLAAGTGLVIFLYGMVGVELFGVQNPGDFGNIGNAMLTMFMLVTLENLPDIMHTGLDITPWAVPYFASYALVMGFLLFNLFIGVVLNAMEQAREAAQDDMSDMDLDEAISTATQALEDLVEIARARKAAGK